MLFTSRKKEQDSDERGLDKPKEDRHVGSKGVCWTLSSFFYMAKEWTALKAYDAKKKKSFALLQGKNEYLLDFPAGFLCPH